MAPVTGSFASNTARRGVDVRDTAVGASAHAARNSAPAAIGIATFHFIGSSPYLRRFAGIRAG
jgi:hypothetical protein